MKIKKETMRLIEGLLNQDYDIEICNSDEEFLVTIIGNTGTEVFTECEFIHEFSF